MVSLALGRIGRIRPEGHVLAQEIFDVRFAEIETNLREIGVSDEGMKYKIRKMADSFMGCMNAYAKLIDGNPSDSWELAISRNVFQNQGKIAPGSSMLVKRVMEINAFLDGVDDRDVIEGKMIFPSGELASGELESSK